MESRRQELDMRNLLETVRSDWRKVCADAYAPGDLSGGDLAQLGLLEQAAAGLDVRLRSEIRSCEAAVEAAAADYLQARARVEMLQKLESRRRAEWQQESEREQAAFVDELFLLRLPHRDRGSD